ncbi:hypothetical protein H9P43_009425 [Blastocladiella emersonii ATCC 22665]|nr:hypothetical protein H9P43_009425 [Blastocladiella emersonii ATCC 22665]
MASLTETADCDEAHLARLPDALVTLVLQLAQPRSTPCTASRLLVTSARELSIYRIWAPVVLRRHIHPVLRGEYKVARNTRIFNELAFIVDQVFYNRLLENRVNDVGNPDAQLLLALMKGFLYDQRQHARRTAATFDKQLKWAVNECFYTSPNAVAELAKLRPDYATHAHLVAPYLILGAAVLMDDADLLETLLVAVQQELPAVFDVRMLPTAWWCLTMQGELSLAGYGSIAQMDPELERSLKPAPLLEHLLLLSAVLWRPNAFRVLKDQRFELSIDLLPHVFGNNTIAPFAIATLTKQTLTPKELMPIVDWQLRTRTSEPLITASGAHIIHYLLDPLPRDYIGYAAQHFPASLTDRLGPRNFDVIRSQIMNAPPPRVIMLNGLISTNVKTLYSLRDDGDSMPSKPEETPHCTLEVHASWSSAMADLHQLIRKGTASTNTAIVWFPSNYARTIRAIVQDKSHGGLRGRCDSELAQNPNGACSRCGAAIVPRVEKALRFLLCTEPAAALADLGPNVALPLDFWALVPSGGLDGVKDSKWVSDMARSAIREYDVGTALALFYLLNQDGFNSTLGPLVRELASPDAQLMRALMTGFLFDQGMLARKHPLTMEKHDQTISHSHLAAPFLILKAVVHMDDADLLTDLLDAVQRDLPSVLKMSLPPSQWFGLTLAGEIELMKSGLLGPRFRIDMKRLAHTFGINTVAPLALSALPGQTLSDPPAEYMPIFDWLLRERKPGCMWSPRRIHLIN